MSLNCTKGCVANYTDLLLGRSMSAQAEIRERVTGQIIEALRKGLTPWKKSWSDLENSGYPTNVASKKPYHGINPLILQIATQRRGFTSKWWGTFNQWKSLGGQVTKRRRVRPPAHRRHSSRAVPLLAMLP